MHDPRSSGSVSTALVDTARKAAGGDRSAMEDLLVQLHTCITRSLQYRLGGDPYAEGFIEDAVQESLYRIALSLGSCCASTDQQFLAWVRTIARHVAIDWLRSNHVRYMTLLFKADLEESASRTSYDEWRCGTDAEFRSAKEIVIQILHGVLEAMPDVAHRILWFRLVEQASWSDVAAEIGTTSAGAKRRFQRIQQALRTAVHRRIHKLPDAERAAVLNWLHQIGTRAHQDR